MCLILPQYPIDCYYSFTLRKQLLISINKWAALTKKPNSFNGRFMLFYQERPPLYVFAILEGALHF